MNETKNKSSREALHVRAVLIRNDGPRSSPAQNTFLGNRLLQKRQFGGVEGAWTSFIQVKTEFKAGEVQLGPVTQKASKKSYGVPPALLQRVLKSNNECIFEPLVCAMPLGERQSLFVVTPFVPVLRELFHKTPTTYHRIDLRRVCDDQFAGSTDAKIKVVRLHCKVEGDLGERMSSATCNGKNVVTSDAFRDLLGFKENKKGKRVTPFSAEALAEQIVSRGIDPVSCRLKWDDGSDATAALNMDRYGNFSFYLRDTATVPQFLPIFQYLEALGALVTTEVDPLDRSDSALREVDAQ